MKQLFFDGHSYPSVTATEAAGGFITLATSGKGRHWTADRPRGFWRTFSELKADSVDDVTMFLRRYGDPADLIDRGGTSHNAYWAGYIARLAKAAAAWDDPGKDGISRMTKDARRREAARWFGETPFEKVDEVYPVRDRATGDFRLKPFTLMAYMTVSAILMIQADAPMRRCDHCGHWMDASHAAGRFCSPACRNAALRAKEA